MTIVRAVKWSAARADVGDTVTLSAELEQVREAGRITFMICEYIGIPPQSGGGSRQVEFCRLSVPIAKGASRASVTWTVSVPPAVEAGLPDFIFRAAAHEDARGVASELLKLGEVKAGRWLPARDRDGKRPPDEGRRVKFGPKGAGLVLEVDGLAGFQVDFIIRQVTSKLGTWPEVGRVVAVPIEHGRAEADWVPPEQRTKDLVGSEFVFDVELSHPSSPTRMTSASWRSKRAKFVPAVRLYFALFDNRPKGNDQAFQRAANTWAKSVPGAHDHGPEIRFRMLGFGVEADFIRAWKRLLDELEEAGPEAAVVEGHIFSHASKGDEVDGLEFVVHPSETLSRQEIERLPRLPWDSEGSLVLHGCNTGLVGEQRGWCPASAFASSQRVRTLGQAGFSFFSAVPDEYQRITRETPAVYLWAYHHSHNAPGIGNKARIGTGRRIDGVWFGGTR